MKRCYMCKTEKPLDQFHKCCGRTDGRQTKCIACQTEYQRLRRKTPQGKSYEQRRRVMFNRTEVGLAYRRQASLRFRSSEMGAAKAKLWCKRYAETNPEKVRAHKRLWKAVKAGRVQKKPCEVCGSSKVDGHHEDYCKPLEVRWLCRRHHGEEHRRVQV